MSRKLVGIDARGYTVGEDHPQAWLSDADVDLIRQLHEEHGLGYRALARKFECSRSTIRDIVKYRRRFATPDSYKREGAASSCTRGSHDRPEEGED